MYKNARISKRRTLEAAPHVLFGRFYDLRSELLTSQVTFARLQFSETVDSNVLPNADKHVEIDEIEPITTCIEVLKFLLDVSISN